jgi:hypothetical protein
MLATMYRACRRAVAFNIFHPHPDARWETLVSWAGYYSVPRETLLGWCRRLSAGVETGPGVNDREATVYIRRC